MSKRQTKIGWFLLEDEASHIFYDPISISSQRTTAISPKAVQSCPAVNEYENRVFTISSPYSLDLKVNKNQGIFSFSANEKNTSLNKSQIKSLISLMPKNEWRSLEKPVIQIPLPYCFVSDENVFLNQVPQTLDPMINDASLICGRFPIKNWVRPLSFALEFHNFPGLFKIKRGDPLFCILFETPNNTDHVSLIRAQKTDKLIQFTKSCSGVVGKVNNAFAVMKTASSRRPKRLLTEE